MFNKKQIGDQGELIAVDLLTSKGYEIIEHNWRFSRAEIDIICKKEDCLVFVEVKTKAYTYFGQPSESVTPRKSKLLMDAANEYMKGKQYAWRFRFDIIGILMKDEKVYKIDHFEDAFFSEW